MPNLLLHFCMVKNIFSFKKFLFKYTLMHTENSCKSLESKFHILLCTLVSMQVCDKIPLGHNPLGQNPLNLKLGQNPLIIIIGVFCPIGFLSQGVFVLGGYWQGDFVRGDIVLSGGLLSWGDIVLGGILSGGILVGGFCPGGFCLGGYCPGSVGLTPT